MLLRFICFIWMPCVRYFECEQFQMIYTLTIICWLLILLNLQLLYHFYLDIVTHTQIVKEREREREKMIRNDSFYEIEIFCRRIERVRERERDGGKAKKQNKRQIYCV